MSSWSRFIRRVAAHGGVATPGDARAVDLPVATYHRRTRAEGWNAPFPGVRVAPWAPQGPRTLVGAALAACHDTAAAAGMTALWLEGLAQAPPPVHLVIPHGARVPPVRDSSIRIVRCRWLRADDVVVRDGIARLRPEVLPVSLAGHPRPVVMGAFIDLVQAGRTTPDRVLSRLVDVGPIRGRAELIAMAHELGGKRPESWFHDLVLNSLRDRGYPVHPAPRRVETPDGRGMLGDIPMPAFRVILDPQGDTYHRSISVRRADRRRVAQIAGTDHVLVPIDWRDWHLRQAWVLDTIDAAVLRQLRAGYGAVDDLPPHLRDRAQAA